LSPAHDPVVDAPPQAYKKSILISEILDSRTKSLIAVAKVSDYILSNELVAMAMAMVAENRDINAVLAELFAAEGQECYLRDGSIYVRDGESLNFWEIFARGRLRSELVFGWKLVGEPSSVINPPNKSDRRTWSMADRIIVLAED
jgi:hypothetical protein